MRARSAGGRDAARRAAAAGLAFDRGRNTATPQALLRFEYRSAKPRISVVEQLAGKGGLQKAWGLFGKELDGLMDEMNGELVA